MRKKNDAISKKPENKVNKENNKVYFLYLKSYADSLKKYAAKMKCNTETAFIVDMKQGSGKKRFFVYDYVKDTILIAGLVTHGNCNKWWLEGRKYSNVPGCGCTSLGRYKIGNPYQGRFGLAYKLYGLDTSNSKAFDRFVVLHSHSCVPNNEVDDEICQSNGCPTVSPEFLLRLQKIIEASSKPILLWIVD